ncbi:distal tail protein Dit [Bacillus sp. JJ1562]|uniref:distal tail protein Dit n=1 Tax=Bacillus sp. JJ1562 TaxID=3122960 RepID=UPI0030017A65
MSFSFDGITKSYIRAVRGVERPTWAPIEHEIIEIPGRPGGYISGKKIKVRVINVPIEVRGLNSSNLQSLKEELAAWLITDEPKKLIFNDEPNRIYYAEVTEELDLDEILWKGKGVITFLCPDPYKYGEEQTVTGTGPLIVENEGTAESYPVITCKLKKDTTFVAVGNGEEINMIGEPVSVDDIVFEPKTIILNDSMASTVGWGAAGFTPDGSVKTGTVTSNGNNIIPSSYGTGTAWHGPAVQKSLSQQLQDFSVEFTFVFNARTLTELGKVQLYGLDPTNKKIFMLGMSDMWNSYEQNMPEGYLYNANEVRKEVLVRNANEKWEGFYGYIRITRIGREIEFFLKKVDSNGKELATKAKKYFDSTNEYQTKLVSIGLHFAQFGAYLPIESLGASHVTVTRINQQQGIPIIGRVGDVVVFDNKRKLITLNGEDINNEKAFIGKYFSVKPGQSALVAEPFDAIESLKVRWPTAWL